MNGRCNMNVAILGHFGGNKTFNDGQTVKTRTLYHALLSEGVVVYPLDTYDLKRHPLRFVWRFWSSLFSYKKYIVLLSANGRKFLFPVLYALAKYMNKQIYHDSIGGRLADEAAQNVHFKKQISAFAANWVESRLLEKRLREQGVTNAVYVPNFKLISPLDAPELPAMPNSPLRFCTFSRVVKEKGITDAILALAKLNEQTIKATLTVYGPVAPEYKTEFEQLCQKYDKFCTYGGVISPNDSVAVLKNYDMLLFPTRWYGEGLPGTVIDAFCAGLPILARRWKYCDEMITHLQTGLVYDFDKSQELKTGLNFAITHPQEIYAMRKACLAAGKVYTKEEVLPQILQGLNSL